MNLNEVREKIEYEDFLKHCREEIAEVMEFMPLWRIVLRTKINEKVRDIPLKGLDWLLPRVKQRTYENNVGAGNPNCDPDYDPYFYYERLK